MVPIIRLVLLISVQAQTPQQRKANEAFAKKAESKRGKPEDKRVVKKNEKSPISKTWISVSDEWSVVYNV